MKNGTESKQERIQIQFRVPVKLNERLRSEVQRQGRKRDQFAIRVLEYFLSLKTSERDEICSKAA